MNAVAFAVGTAGLLLPTAVAVLDSHYVSTAGRYAVTFPKSDNPIRRYAVTAPRADAEVTVVMAVRDDAASSYVVAYCDYPVESILRADPEAEVETVSDGILVGMKGKELSLTRMKVEGRTARELTFELSDGRPKCKARVFYVKNRLYQLIAYDKDGAAVDRFLDSFELLKAK